MFRYNGTADSGDIANSIVYGADGNIYVAGYSQGVGTGRDFMVISLNKDTGDTNWVFRYNGPGNGADAAYSLVYGADSNIYVAGYSIGSGTSTDFMVISLNKNTGDTNWVYRYNGPVDSSDVANSVVYGLDGNIYAAGYSQVNGTYRDFTIISLTSAGSERWVYRFNGSGSGSDIAKSIIYGNDDNIYSAGYSWSSGTITEFTVVSVTSAGVERWVYTDSIDGEAYCLVYGSDGNIYAAGYFNIYYDIGIMSFTASGSERWRYSYAGPPGSSGDDLDEIRSIVYGSDGNIYAAGVSDSTDWIDPTDAFTVISLTSAGSERWVYRYYSGVFDWANSIVYGADSNLYAAGMCFQGTRTFGVISLTPADSERWIYRYNNPYVDEANSIIYGADGNLYAAGYSENRNTPFAQDILVVSLDPETGIEEQSDAMIYKESILSIATLQRKRLDFSLFLPEPLAVRMFLYNIAGAQIASWVTYAPEGTSRHTKELSVLSTGIYFLKGEIRKDDHHETRKIIYMK